MSVVRETVDTARAAQLVKAHREHRGISQDEMASRLQITRSAWNRLEQGNRELTPEKLGLIATALNIRVEDLFYLPAGHPEAEAPLVIPPLEDIMTIEKPADELHPHPAVPHKKRRGRPRKPKGEHIHNEKPTAHNEKPAKVAYTPRQPLRIYSTEVSEDGTVIIFHLADGRKVQAPPNLVPLLKSLTKNGA